MSTATSTTLLDGLRREGGEQAWREFFARYAPIVLATAKAAGLADDSAADAVQETMLSVHTAFRGGAEPYERGKGRFKYWLKGVARHKAADSLRRQARQARAENNYLATSERQDIAEPEWDSWFEMEWQRQVLAETLRRVAREIDPVMYQAFELYAIHGRPAQQVARLLQITRNMVYISRSRMIRRIRSVSTTVAQEME